MALVERVVNIYKTVTRYPAPVFAEILKSDGIFVSVLSKWSQSNVETGKKVSTQQIYLLDNSLNKIQDFPPVDISQELCSSLSPCGTLKAVIRESIPATGKTSQQYLEIWHGHQLQLNRNLTALDIHGSVYTEADFASLVWSPSGDKIAYIAEERVPKSEPFLPLKKPDSDSGKPVTKGEQYELRDDWGEQLVGRHQPVVVVCEVKPGAQPSLLTGIPPKVSPGQLAWTPDGNALIGVAWENDPRRLGLIYCTNRLSHIFLLSLDGGYKILSTSNVAVRAPRCSPDNSQVVWLERKAGGPHHGCMRLMGFNMETNKLRTVVDLVEECMTLKSGEHFYGLYSTTLPRRCWTNDGKHLIVNSPQIDKVVPYLINIENGSIEKLDKNQQSDECKIVLDVWQDLIVSVSSTMRLPHCIHVGRLLYSESQPQIKSVSLTSLLQPDEFKSLVYESLILEAQQPGSIAKKFSAIYMGPSSGSTRSVPLIVWPHGGPHAMFACDYKAEAMFFVLLGFGVLMVNYRGSVGFGESSVSSLLGHVGDNDVSDVHQATQETLARFPLLDPEHCVLFGGSHGGFLVTHLSGQFPDSYKAVAARNPVTDIATLLCTSDIPDWSAVVCGWEYSEIGPRSTEQLVQMRRRSPIWHACSVKAPTLLMVGSCDLRVPSSQAMLYYHHLKAQGTKVKVYMYEDNHPLGKVPNDIDNIINSALWFIQHTSTE